MQKAVSSLGFFFPLAPRFAMAGCFAMCAPLIYVSFLLGPLVHCYTSACIKRFYYYAIFFLLGRMELSGQVR